MQESLPSPLHTARARRVAWIASCCAALAVAFLVVRSLLADPSVVFIKDEAGAHWIRARERLNVAARPAGTTQTQFRARFQVATVPARAELVVRALRDVSIALDGKPLRPLSNVFDRWREPVVFDLAPLLKPGRHELFFTVANANAHAALLGHCAALGLASGVTWEASTDGKKWDRALPVDEYWPAKISRDVPPAPVLVRQAAPYLALVFLAAAAWTVARARGHLARVRLTPAGLRWILLGAWLVLGINNLQKVPAIVGFDMSAHLEYIRYIAQKGALPYANEGWQMFQAPLYYIVSVPLYAVFEGVKSLPIEKTLRVLPLACGALQVEIGYRVMRAAFKDRSDLALLGTWIAGLLPMNLYISQVVGNEPLAGALSALVLLLCVQRLCADPGEARKPRIAWLGVALGLALLSKATAVLLIPLVVVAVWWSSVSRGTPWSKSARSSCTAVVIALAVGGWFYLRNYVKFGQAMIGGWDPLIGIPWWQDPSYRIPEHFTRFGEVFVYPIYSATRGVWDAFYSSLWLDGTLSGCIRLPPWNYPAMISCAWLGLPVTLAIMLGMVVPLSEAGNQATNGAARRVQVFSTMAFLVFMAALLLLYLKLPIFSTAKATYTLGLTPLYGFLAAAGLRPCLRNVYARAVIHGLVVCLGVCAYASYFVWSAPSEPWPA